MYRNRDADRGYPLRDLIEILAAQAEVLEKDIARLYDNQFIETCEPWVVPYIGDLIGMRALPPLGRNGRAEVANMIGYRRRKGTAAVLEDLARDVTGWPARVVEFFELLPTTQYMNHLRLHRPRTPDVRDANALDHVDRRVRHGRAHASTSGTSRRAAASTTYRASACISSGLARFPAAAHRTDAGRRSG